MLPWIDVKRMGILGGVSAESTTTYYLTTTRECIHRFGDTGYPEILISVSFAPYAALQHVGRWSELAAEMGEGSGPWLGREPISVSSPPTPCTSCSMRYKPVPPFPS